MTKFDLCPRRATRADAEYVATFMRHEDRLEFEAASGMSAFRAIEFSLLSSPVALCADDADSCPMCLFGYRQTAPGEAMCWLCGTHEMEMPYAKRAFWRLSKQMCAELCARFKRVWGFVDCRHEASLRWLSRLGFSMSEPFAFGAAGELFMRFERVRGDGLWAL